MVLSALISLVGTIGGTFFLASMWVWRRSNSLNGEEDLDRVEELEDDQWSSVSSNLGDLYTNVEESLKDSERRDEISRKEYVIEVIERQVDPEELEDFVQELRKVGDVKQLYRNEIESYKSCYMSMAQSSAYTFGLGGLLLVGLVYNFGENQPLIWFASAIVSMIALTKVKEGAEYFLQAQEYRDELEERWREYRTTTPDVSFE